MNTPAESARRFAAAAAVGLALGVYYCFLRPLRRRGNGLRDWLFLPAVLYGWVWVSFAVCAGDIRMGNTLGLFAGMALGERSIGRLLNPIFFTFWRYLAAGCRIAAAPLKKILQFSKILFASGEKWVTICLNTCRRKRQQSGGVSHGKQDLENRKNTGHLSSQQHTGEGSDYSGYRIFYGSTGGSLEGQDRL